MSSLDLPPGPAPVVFPTPPVDPISARLPDIIPDILPSRQVHLFSGASGAGKTALTFQFLAAMFESKPFFELQPRKPAFIGYLAADRSWEDHEKWLRTVGLLELPYYSMIEDFSVPGKSIREKKFGDRFDLFKRGIGKLLVASGIAPSGSKTEEALKFIPKDSFFVVDPISLFLGGDLLSYDTSYSHMLDLNQFCLKFSCTILGIAHAGKQKGGADQKYARPQDRIVGTTAQTGCAGTTMHLAPETEVGKKWSEWTFIPHHAPTTTVPLLRDSRGLFVRKPEAMVSDKEQKAAERSAQKTNRLLPLIPEDGSPIHTSLLVATAEKELSLSQSQVYRYLGTLEDLGEVKRSGPPGLWQRKGKN